MIESIQKQYAQLNQWSSGMFNSSLQIRVIIVLAAVLALDSADTGALTVTATQIQHYFNISRTDFGLLGSITTAVSAAATLPFGLYIDRTLRIRLLAWSIAVWGLAMLLGGAAPNYSFLLGSRILLGAVTAVAYPAIASLIGDYFMPDNRGRAYGWILSGEFIGSGLGIALSGEMSAIFSSWRAAEFILVLPAALVFWAVIKLPEPERGLSDKRSQQRGETIKTKAIKLKKENPVFKLVEDDNIKHHPKLIVKKDPQRMSLIDAVIYAIKVKTNLIIIIATGLGYFFFTGLNYFAIQFVQQHYHVSHTAAAGYVIFIGLGGVIGVIASGKFTDWWLLKGHYNSRIVIPAISFLISAALLAFGIYTTSIGVAIVLFIAAAIFFEASNPPLDAARLDIMLPSLWGRAESTRIVFRGAIVAFAPVTFGLVSDRVFVGGNSLEYTFLLMLIPLVLAGFVLFAAVKTYARDVATTIKSIDNLAEVSH